MSRGPGSRGFTPVAKKRGGSRPNPEPPANGSTARPWRARVRRNICGGSALSTTYTSDAPQAVHSGAPGSNASPQAGQAKTTSPSVSMCSRMVPSARA
jgi:hypothetical protein